MLPVSSQTSSNECIVPCSTLRNALKTKAELEFTYNKLSVVRDSVISLNSIIKEKNVIISNKDKEIFNLNNSLTQSDSISIENKKRGDTYEKEAKKQKDLKWLSIVLGSLGTLCGLFIF
jgi:hypothetical protein